MYSLIQVLYIYDISAKVKVKQLVGNNIATEAILCSVLVAYIVAIILFLDLAPFYALVAVWVSKVTIFQKFFNLLDRTII